MYQTEIYIAPTRQGTVNISSGSDTVTGNDTNFVSTDVGKQIRVRTDDGYKVYVITAVASETSITISSTADFGQINCYFNTDFAMLDVDTDTGMKVTYSIFDISEPDKRGGTVSKTLNLPGTARNNIVFNHIFEIGMDGTFNPNIKADCLIYQDMVEIFRGSFRLIQIDRTMDKIAYECVVLGRVTNIYTAFGDKTLSDIDLSEFDHDYTQSVQASSWSLTSSNGYVYPMIDYGETDSSNQTIWQVNQLYPAIYVKALLDKIFALAGFTYSSSFFASGFFNKLIIPFNAGSFKYSETEVATRLFEAGMLSTSASLASSTTDQYLTIPYNDATTLPDFDPSSQFDTTTHSWTVAKSGHYNLNLITNLQYSVTNSTGLTVPFDFPGYIEMVIVRASVTLPITPALYNDISSVLHYVGTGSTFTKTANSRFENMPLIAGDVVSFRLHLFPWVSGFTMNVDILANSCVYNEVVNENITEGDSVVMTDVVPQNIRISDFFRSITNMFNLYIDEDPNIPNRLNIEPRNDFYGSGTILDWTHKWDASQPVNIITMGELTSQNYLFTYRSDTDYWNDKYSKQFIQKDHNEIYGEYWLPIENDFLTDTTTIDVIFAPTVLSQYTANGLIVPSVRFIDTNPALVTGKPAPKSSVIRILYYGGLLSGNWTFRSMATGTASDTSESSYPYAGHFDDPVSPTLDINFGLPAELYYAAKGQTVTDNNLYNQYYSSQIDEITDKDSKVVEMYLRLNPQDINNLDFRNQVFIAGHYYRILEITDYDLTARGLTQCRFLKIKNPKPFSPSTHNLNGGKGGNVGNQRVPVLNYSALQGFSGLLSGSNNTTKNKQVLVNGDGNAISGQKVQILGGNNNVVDANNVTLINTSGQTITTNGVTYIDGEPYIKPMDMSGQAVLSAGTVTVSFPGILPTSIILISFAGTGTLTGSLQVFANTNSFTISSTSLGDSALINWYVAKK